MLMRFYAHGVFWPSENEVPDMGTLSFIGEQDGCRQYRCLSADKDVLELLPKDQLNSGDACMCTDTFDYGEYLSATETWYWA